jgi:hypothetical protein
MHTNQIKKEIKEKKFCEVKDFGTFKEVKMNITLKQGKVKAKKIIFKKSDNWNENQ